MVEGFQRRRLKYEKLTDDRWKKLTLPLARWAKTNIISNSTGSLEVNWQKTHNNCSKNLMINCPKYYGSSCQVNNPHLVITSIDKEDAGIYKLEVISPTENICFLPSFSSYGWGVSEEKIKIWKVNRWQMEKAHIAFGKVS
jgi:hypothetical protein